MTDLGDQTSGPVIDYNQIYSPKGLLLRYARGRIRHFVNRQIFAVAAGIILCLLVSPIIGVVAIAVVFFGDVVDCLYLHNVPRLIERGHSMRRVMIFSGATAGFQALTTSACVWLSWEAQHAQAEPLFALGLLISATINAGLVLPYNRMAGAVRLAIYGLTPIAILVAERLNPEQLDAGEHINMAGLAMLYTLLIWFLSFMVDNFHRHRKNTQAQFEQHQQLEVSNALLQEQQQQARRLALVAEHASDSVFLIDRNGKISWVNDSFTRITGYSYSEAIGRTPCELLGTDEADPEAVSKLIANRDKGLPFRVQLKSRCKDGSLIWIETNQVPVRGFNGEVEMVVAVERDVTAAHLHAQQLEEARISAEEGERTKADFLATMSHEIRTPMNGVIGMAQMLEATQLDKNQKLYTDTILSSSKTLLALINDVLDVSKLDAEKMTFSLVDFELRTCFEETLCLLRTQAVQKGLKLKLSVPDELPVRVHGDDRRIRQIILNLVGNALKFTEQGEVAVGVDIQPVDDRLELSFSVTDTGIGISQDKLTHVFERFSQAETATTRRFGGTGLGLTISRKLAEAMDGEIEATSELGVGSCFTVKLLLDTAQSPISTSPNCTGASTIQSQGFDGMKVLVAEDNKVNRLVMRKFLRDVPVELEFAHNGSEAVEKVQSMKPHLVFMDMSMPVMNGIDATLAIRSNGGLQPVIVALTANAFDSDRDACLEAGMNGFLSKPLNRSEVLAEMQRHHSTGEAHLDS